jgi:hypothetical protein
MTMRSSDYGESSHEFHEGFTWKDEPLVWRLIGKDYLRKYGGFLRVDFDWMADGLWERPFPGSVYMGISVCPEYYGMPGSLVARVQAWQTALDRLDVSEKIPDLEASNAEGLEIARGVKLFLGDDYYVEYWPFREISIRDGEAVELEVPSFIAGLAR